MSTPVSRFFDLSNVSPYRVPSVAPPITATSSAVTAASPATAAPSAAASTLPFRHIDCGYGVEIETSTEFSYATPGSSGVDVRSSEDTVIFPRSQRVVHTGIRIVRMPDNMEAQIRSRSGSAFKHNVFVFNGTIDSDFRDSINVLMMNNGDENYTIKAGDRVAQLIFSPIFKLHLPRGDARSGGFGSTGIK